MIWNYNDFIKRDHKHTRVNIEFDHITKVCWSPDDKALVVHKCMENNIEVYKLTKKPDGTYASATSAHTFPQHNPEADLVALDMALNGKYIMTCNNKNQLVIWNLHGEILECVDTRHGDTYSARLSPCGRYVATTGFTPDVKVWEVKFSKAGTFEGLKRAYDLSGHKAGIYSCDINSDSTRMVSVSKDGTWRLYDTNIEYEKGQLVYLLHSGSYVMKGKARAIIRLSPNARTIVVSSGPSMTFYSASTGEKFSTISDIYIGPILDMFFDPASKLLLTLGDRHVRVFHNMAGYTSTIQDLQQSLKKSTSAGMKERIIDQIKEAKRDLENINNTIAQQQKKK
ncbi:hypothetical protein Pmani_008066 [Petrolisthes manimaculis]|uniref:Translation initiation factor beta propellor-like domain-containing protein n=1 Tax=Petrolisthes manimaculis TaxID=1843537 RepID=A0AAE1Q736_9EUCA|nr:hypothetical protein Pmani_008066 [Petrolisthes manimaculis]